MMFCFLYNTVFIHSFSYLLSIYCVPWVSQMALVVAPLETTCQCRRDKRHGLDPWIGKVPWRRAWQPTLVFLPRESHGQRSLVGYSP